MSISFWRNLPRPIKVLAPMAGYTDAAFRLLCRENGADVVVSELISADAIAYSKFKVEKRMINSCAFWGPTPGDPSGKPEPPKNAQNCSFVQVVASKNHATAEMLSFFESERPFVVQLFGKYPEKFARATEWLTGELKPDGIDINMGCPARKVVGSDHGAALLKNPDLACEIVRAVKANTSLPVSVKTRLGWDSDDQILEFGPRLVEAGAEALIIHGRTYKDGFNNEARWENIYRLKEMLGDKAVVIGNGDIQSVEISKLKVQSCGERSTLGLLDGYAIGRAAFGKPWIFGPKMDHAMPAGRQELNEPRKLKKLVLRHARLAYEVKGEKGMIEFRKHFLCYLKGFENAKQFRAEAAQVKKLEDVVSIVNSMSN